MATRRQIAADGSPAGTRPGTGVPAARQQKSRVPTRSAEAFALLLVTHFAVDCFSSALPTVQPLLTERFSLSLAQAGMLGGFFMFSSSVLQLPFGLVSDRLQSRHFTIMSPLVAAVFLSSLGLATGFGGLFGLLLVGGMGIAAYHPHSTSQAGRLGGRRRGIATAIFITVGTAGLGLGPLYLTYVIERVGFGDLWMSSIPVVAMLPVLLWRLPRPVRNRHKASVPVDWNAIRRQGKPLAIHYALVVLRSIVQVAFAQFLSLYMVTVRAASFEQASAALSVYLLSTPIGSFLGGAATDRYGGRGVILVSSAGCIPFLAMFLASEGWLSMLALFVGGVLLLATVPVNVVMAQRLVPSQASTITALMMGFGWGVAGIVFMPAVGLLADGVGLGPVFWGLLGLPVLGIPLAAALPIRRGRVR